jgi:hypothetical protein
MMGLSTNNELERIWEEIAMAITVLFWHFPGRAEEDTVNLSHYCQYSSWDSN